MTEIEKFIKEATARRKQGADEAQWEFATLLGRSLYFVEQLQSRLKESTKNVAIWREATTVGEKKNEQLQAQLSDLRGENEKLKESLKVIQTGLRETISGDAFCFSIGAMLSVIEQALK